MIDVLRSLTEQEVSFILVGGMAAAFHGSDGNNMDCDLVISSESQNLKSFLKALTRFAPRMRKTGEPWTDHQNQDFEILNLETTGGLLDCHGYITGIGDYKACPPQSIEVPLKDFKIRVLTRDALITAKKAMGRPKDLLTVAQLEIGGELEDK